jgi:hypothetical protein
MYKPKTIFIFFLHIYLFKVVSKLTPVVMADIDRILGNKPNVRITTKNEILQNKLA